MRRAQRSGQVLPQQTHIAQLAERLMALCAPTADTIITRFGQIKPREESSRAALNQAQLEFSVNVNGELSSSYELGKDAYGFSLRQCENVFGFIS